MLSLNEFRDDLMLTLNDQLRQSVGNRKYAAIFKKDERTEVISLLDCPYSEFAAHYRRKAGACRVQGFAVHDLYQKYKECKSVEEIADQILERFLPIQTSYDISEIADYSYVKDHMVLRCMNRSFVNTLSDDAVCYHFSDITMYIQIAVDMEGETQYIDITKRMFDDYRIGKQRLLMDAIASSMKLCEAVYLPLSEFIQVRDAATSAILPDKEERLNAFFAVTNETGENGTAVMFYPSFLKELSNKYGGSFYIVPTSIHGFITFPDTDEIDPETWQSLLYDANHSLEQHEKFSDHIFYYDAQRKALRTYETHSFSRKAGFRFS